MRNTVSSELNAILEGAGWCSDEYIINFSPLGNKNKYALMLELAKRKKLYLEGDLEDVDDTEPKTGRMSVLDVEKEWAALNK